MEDQERRKQESNAIVGAAAFGAALLPILALLLNVVDALTPRGSIFDVLQIVSYLLLVPVGMFGLFGFVVLAVFGAALFGFCRWIMHHMKSDWRNRL